jgi:DNA primase catalytic subunit
MSSQIDLFRNYYNTVFRPDSIVLPDTKFRHFRFEIFSEKTRKFRRLKDIIESKEQLWQRIARIVPKNAYFTPTKWLNPIYVGKTKKELNVMLSSTLYFDIDFGLLEPPTFMQAKKNTQELINLVYVKYSKNPDLVVFSGKQGFHVYYWDWNSPSIVNLHPMDRIKQFTVERKEILGELSIHGVIVDSQITLDPYRIMKIPNTLHGGTGLIAKPVKDLTSFDPTVDALAFERKYYDSIIKIDLAKIY